jgi:hypothetical protein
MKKTRKMVLSFSLDETRSSMTMAMAGVNYKVSSTSEKELEKLGFFSDSGADPNMFVPVDVQTEIVPKPEDFVKVPFRLLTATTVAAGTWRATEFPESVLKASRTKLDKKPVYLEHDTTLLNWVGLVQDTSWSTATNQDGMPIPAGIDAMLAIDAKTNPKIARAVLSGGVFSNSVTVSFDWKPSHKYEKEWEFNDRVGTIHEDGTMVRRIATKIHDYYETSLVFLGADPYAKLRNDDGTLVHVDSSSVYERSFSKDSESGKTYLNEKRYVEFGFSTENVLSLSRKNYVKPNQVDMFDKILREKLSLAEAVELNEQNVSEAFSKLVDNASTESLALKTEVESLKGKVAANEVLLQAEKVEKESLQAEVESLKARVATLDFMVEAKRKEALRLYGVSVKGKTNKNVEELIQNAKVEALDGLIEQYGGISAGQFSATCTTCGSKEVSFQSSLPEIPETPNSATSTLSVDELRAKYNKQF